MRQNLHLRQKSDLCIHFHLALVIMDAFSHIYVGANPFRLFAFANTAALLCRGPVVPLWITEINLRHL